jgi:hypothetical protein
MSNLVALADDGLPKREAKDLSRNLSRLNGRGRLEMFQREQIAEVQAATVRAIGYVGKTAMHETAMISQVEDVLGRMSPAASDRLRGMAELTALAMAEVLGETGRRMRE